MFGSRRPLTNLEKIEAANKKFLQTPSSVKPNQIIIEEKPGVIAINKQHFEKNITKTIKNAENIVEESKLAIEKEYNKIKNQNADMELKDPIKKTKISIDKDKETQQSKIVSEPVILAQ